ncbi:MAG: HepT-like ribonuclease domain-containing protein [Anaerolineae bacterium]
MSEARGLNRVRFSRDETLKRAFVRSIEIIGEAAKQVPAENINHAHHPPRSNGHFSHSAGCGSARGRLCGDGSQRLARSRCGHRRGASGAA